MGYLQLKLLSQDDQSITGSWDTLTGVCVVYTHPGTVPGWSEYLWIPGYSDRAGLCGVYGHPSTVPRWSEYLWNVRILCHFMVSLYIPQTN